MLNWHFWRVTPCWIAGKLWSGPPADRIISAVSGCHKLGDEAADIVLDEFAESIELKHSTLLMPVHESADWESIELGKYTLAFWCRLNG